VGQPLQIEQAQAEDAQAMLEACMVGRRVDQRHQAQLADAGQAAEVGVSITCRTRRVSGTSISGGMRISDRRASRAATSGMSRILDTVGPYEASKRGTR